VDFGPWDASAWLQGLQNASSITHFVPALLLNDFIARIPRATFGDDLATVLGPFAGCFGGPCRVSVAALQQRGRRRVFRCPMGAHTVLFDPQRIYVDDAAPPSARSVRVSVYEQRAMRHLESTFALDTAVVRHTPPLYAHSSLLGADRDASVSWQIRQEHFDEAARPAPVVAAASLAAGELLFVPRNFLVTVEDAEASDDAGRATTVCVMCTVDASNWQLFRGHLQALAPVSAAHDRLFTFLSPARKDPTAVTAGGLSLAMERVLPAASDLPAATVAGFLSKRQTAAVESGGAAADAAADDAATASAAAATAPTNRKDRRKQRGKQATGGTAAGSGAGGGSGGGGGGAGGGGAAGSDFKSWQQQVKWKLAVDALLLPPTSPVELVEVGRSHVTLRFHHAYATADDDRTRLGFQLLLCRWRDGVDGELLDDNLRLLNGSDALALRPTASIVAPDGSLVAKAAARDSHLVCEERHAVAANADADADASGELRQRRVLVPSLRATPPADATEAAAAVAYEELTTYEWTLRGLLPTTRYQLKLAMVYGSRRGPFSAWTRRLRTAAVSAPETPRAPTRDELRGSFDAEAPFFPPAAAFHPAADSPFLPATIVVEGDRLAAQLLVRREDDDGGAAVRGYVLHQLAVPYAALQRHLLDADAAERLFQRHERELQRFDEAAAGDNDIDAASREHRLQLFLGELLLRQLAADDDRDADAAGSDGDEDDDAAVARGVALDGSDAERGLTWRCLGAFPFDTVTKRGHQIARDFFAKEATVSRRVVVGNLQPDTFYAFKVRLPLPRPVAASAGLCCVSPVSHLCLVCLSRVCVVSVSRVCRGQVRAFNDHGVSGVSARSVFVAWELHRREASSSSSSAAAAAAGDAAGDELLVSENSSVVRRVVYVPGDGRPAPLPATATEEERAKDAAAEQAALQQRVGRHGGFTVHGRGHPVRPLSPPPPLSPPLTLRRAL
jgi:uncharacterized membrane protein YgcG